MKKKYNDNNVKKALCVVVSLLSNLCDEQRAIVEYPKMLTIKNKLC